MQNNLAEAHNKPLIVHVAVGGSAVTGVIQHLWTLLPRLEQHGWPVRLVFLGGGDVVEQSRRRGLCCEVVKKRGRGDLLTIPRLARLFSSSRPALVHTHTLTTNFYGRMAAFLAKVPRCVTTVHSFMGDLLRYDTSGRIGNRLLFMQNQYVNRFADRLIAVSEGVRDWLIESGLAPERIRVIRCGLELGEVAANTANRQTARERWGVRPEDWLIGNVARLDPVKDQMTLLEAVLPILRQDAAVKLALVGEGPEKIRLQERVQTERLCGQIILPGMVENARQLMGAFDLFALSSQMEGIPLVLLEAMAAGRPVVATRVGGVPELIENEVSGLLVAPGCPGELTAALLRLRNDPELAQRLAAAGRRSVEDNYDAEKTSREVSELYRELLGG